MSAILRDRRGKGGVRLVAADGHRIDAHRLEVEIN
jgi:hypothetical protein